MSERLTIAHGAGGKETSELVKRLVVSRVPKQYRRALEGVGLDELDDGAAVKVGSSWVVFSVDSYTVKPIKFPGGDLGHLAASGTINDVLMMGARPVALMDALVAEEGTEVRLLEEIIDSFVRTATGEGVAVVGGDFKVMPRGAVDGVIMGAFGVGITNRPPIVDQPSPGDAIIVSGPIGDHGAVITAAQLGMLEEVEGLSSDAAPLTKCVLPIIEGELRDSITALRDATRGGLGAVLNEWAEAAGATIVVRRGDVPVRPATRGFLEMLGIDPLHSASEGVAVFAVRPSAAEKLVRALRGGGCRDAAIIGEVREAWEPFLAGRVVVETEVGGMTLLPSTPLTTPRIC